MSQILITRPYPLEKQLNALCKCSECGMTAVCTPMLDFYVTDMTGVTVDMTQEEKDVLLTGRPLVCEHCVTKQLTAQGLQVETIDERDLL